MRQSQRKRNDAVLAIDTNVVIRFLVNDDRGQAASARRLIESEAVWVSRTVLLETEWVLRAAYGFERAAISRALRGFAGLPNVALESPALAAQSLDWFDLGMDFADALHLAAADTGGCSALASFDRKLAASARKAKAAAVKMLAGVERST